MAFFIALAAPVIPYPISAIDPIFRIGSNLFTLFNILAPLAPTPAPGINDNASIPRFAARFPASPQSSPSLETSPTAVAIVDPRPPAELTIFP